jgi:hypothetical protein
MFLPFPKEVPFFRRKRRRRASPVDFITASP